MSTEAPFFSIIIPTYNSAKTIAECLQSILLQTSSDYEVLIMDGLSIDSTTSIARSFSDERIKITTEKDKGVYDAMNKGIVNAKGEWLYFLGSDDTLLDKEVLKDVSNLLLGNICEIVYGDVLLKKHGNIYDGEFNLSKLLKEKNICHQAIFYNSTIFKLLGKYNLNYPILADYDFNLRCFKHPDFIIKYIPRTIAVYNDLDGISTLAHPAKESFLKEIPMMREEIMLTQAQELNALTQELKALKNSISYKLGCFLLKPLRFIKFFFS